MQESGRVKVTFSGSSKAGIKEINQDAFAARCADDNSALYKGAVACIADGVSCSDNSQHASQMSVTHFIEDYFSTPELWGVKQSSAKVLSALNSWLHHHGQQFARHNGFVTTFSSIIIKSNTAHIFHAGDSRVYLYRQAEHNSSGRATLQQYTQDHQQYSGKDKQFLTRALGMESRLDVDYYSNDTQTGDIWLLTTDGVHDTLSDKQILELINQQGFDKNLGGKLVDYALAQGSFDNTSCLFVSVEQLPEKNLDESQLQMRQQVIPPALSVGNKLDQFRVLEVLASGTRSYVYKVQSEIDGNTYCMKTPSNNYADDEEFLQAFAKELWLGSRISHANIMKVFSQSPESKNQGASSSQFMYHIYEYVEGISLRQWMYDNPVPSLAEVRDIAKKIIPPLRTLQRMGMVHRDLKPENIMLLEDAQGLQVKIIDFGSMQVQGLVEMSHLHNETMPQGAVDYMAPEYVISDKAQTLSDLYSLAAIIYEMVSGKLPYHTDKIFREKQQSMKTLYLSQWKYQSLPADKAPRWLDVCLRKALMPDVKLRYQAFSELETDLYKPNNELLSKQESAPLMQRNPVLFWQLLSSVLAALLLIQTFIQLD